MIAFLTGKKKIEEKRVPYSEVHNVLCLLLPTEVKKLKGWVEMDGDVKNLKNISYGGIRDLLGRTFLALDGMRFSEARQVIYENRNKEKIYRFHIKAGPILSGSGKNEKRGSATEHAYLEIIVRQGNCNN
jgi:hypothetical protein